MDQALLNEYRKLRTPHLYYGETHTRPFVVKARDAIRIARANVNTPEPYVRYVSNEYTTYREDGDPESLIHVTVRDDYNDWWDDFDCCDGDKPCGFGVDGVGCQWSRDRNAKHECRHKCEIAAMIESEGSYVIEATVIDPYLGDESEGSGPCGGFDGLEALEDGIRNATSEAAYVLERLPAGHC